ncbi:XRE family transcriptional regulator [Wolbachia endosymbiont of Dirofilaria (Dirofilaria) immitis]|uniref:XRE family transcriptional regulator n=1 Tax=Wolbachia endosymbiont of Dirofilaria (Dirofilaria) immitis TaxID=1812115 RepID=UPI00158D4391|nr:XRE family transcriptional regulator [Wolbachia endosymbiont of Dirofilaria (Dirofilaria) immitis]QKX02325.1 DNA-binding protein [Wolbachia endosymbiont of Dirofilaria (Dirofilaria) immitis]
MQNSQLSYPIVIELGDIKDTKLKLIKVIAQLISKKYRTQKKAAIALRIDQPKVSQINKSKIEGFSLEYLLNLLIALDQDIDMEIKHNSKLI